MNIADAAAGQLDWFKSSYSGAEGGQCVEVATATGFVHVRDSKELTGPVLTVSREAWAGFIAPASGRAV
ncbi:MULTISPECIES: DUF397 domain-containing protein [unclassified Streptomyces]|uniref:DUF397 domain-containing protein n=1 Tax=unclassified Streptomyces TaxID=2593676 RepID=UPI0033BF592B